MAKLQRTVVLVGMMGAGKTSIGRRLASALGVPFKDADAEIEAAANRSVADIFEGLGEAAFREGERKVIARLLTEPPHVLATGGGAFMDEETRSQIKRSAVSIWLRADVDLLVQRVGRKETRPLLKSGDPKDILTRLLRQREPVYSQADFTVDSDAGPQEAVVKRVMAVLQPYLEPSAS